RLRACLVALPSDRRVRRPARAETRRGRLRAAGAADGGDAAPVGVGDGAAMTETLAELLRARFGAALDVAPEAAASATLAGMARHRSIRSYASRPVAPELVRTLAAVALCSPSKSDQQQCDSVIVQDPAKRAALAA